LIKYKLVNIASFTRQLFALVATPTAANNAIQIANYTILFISNESLGNNRKWRKNFK